MIVTIRNIGNKIPRPTKRNCINDSFDIPIVETISTLSATILET